VASPETLPADFVLLLTGYRPESRLAAEAGVEVNPATLVPRHDPETFETNVPGLYVAGSAVCGVETGTVFIENGRQHARAVVRAAAAALG
jgi:thioredoxin reductase (NADPH)